MRLPNSKSMTWRKDSAVPSHNRKTTNQAQVALRELESTAQSYRAMYDSFLQRYAESVQQQSFPISDARVIAEASPPLGKSGPKTWLILVMSTAGGLALGIGAGLVRELINGSLFHKFSGRECVANVLHRACPGNEGQSTTGVTNRQSFLLDRVGAATSIAENRFSRCKHILGSDQFAVLPLC